MINSTIERLRAMKMNALASELERQLDDAESYRILGFEERCIFRSVSAHKPLILCIDSAETVHEKRLNCAWIPHG